MSIGYRGDVPPYPISIEVVSLDLVQPNFSNLDDQLFEAMQNVEGDVICHSVFMDSGPKVAFLLHE